jgi:hypothetical protein
MLSGFLGLGRHGGFSAAGLSQDGMPDSGPDSEPAVPADTSETSSGNMEQGEPAPGDGDQEEPFGGMEKRTHAVDTTAMTEANTGNAVSYSFSAQLKQEASRFERERLALVGSLAELAPAG